MIAINKKRIEHVLLNNPSDCSEIVFSDSRIKIRYEYAQERVSKIIVTLRYNIPFMIQNQTIFLIRDYSHKIKLIYNDDIVRIFKTRAEKVNYIITIL